VVPTPATRQRLFFEFLPTGQDAFPSAVVYIIRRDVAKGLVVPRGYVRERVTDLCDEEAYLVIVDRDGTAKALTQRTYPLPLALQMAQAIPLPMYAGPGASLMELIQANAMRKAQRFVQTPEV